MDRTIQGGSRGGGGAGLGPARFLLVLLLLMVRLDAGEGRRPNFLLILTDDHGIGDVSAYRKADVRTPHLDRLAAEGMRFTAMRANATVCSPSRAALLTGRHPDRVGVPGVIRTRPEDSWGWFDPGTPTSPRTFRARSQANPPTPITHSGRSAARTAARCRSQAASRGVRSPAGR